MITDRIGLLFVLVPLLILQVTHLYHSSSLNLLRLVILAFLFSRQEQVFLNTMTRETSTDFWIGLNDLISEGIFLWTDNSPRKYTYWNVSEPSNNEQSMGCVLMNPHQDEGRWRTASCNQRNGFICETGL